jgi:riboflavin kinase/FMN adenylyltransferase
VLYISNSKNELLKIKSAADYDQIKDSVVTIGTFDGVHRGHQKIINRLVDIAQTEQLQALVLTFFRTLEWWFKKIPP